MAAVAAHTDDYKSAVVGHIPFFDVAAVNIRPHIKVCFVRHSIESRALLITCLHISGCPVGTMTAGQKIVLNVNI